MDQFDLLRSLLTPLDMAALAFYFISMIAYRTFTDRMPSMRQRNLVGAVQRQRDMWLRNMSRRDNRNMDIILLGTVGQGNAFFASTTAIAIGGIAALMGSGERAQSMLEKLPLVAKANGFSPTTRRRGWASTWARRLGLT